MTKFNRTKNFVAAHPVALAATAGLAAGALGVFSFYHGKTLLEITEHQIDVMRTTGNAALYVTKFGDLIVTATPKQ